MWLLIPIHHHHHHNHPKTKNTHTQTGAAFLSLRISDIVRGEIGTAEIALRDVFRAAVRSRPALIFIDEFQVGVCVKGWCVKCCYIWLVLVGLGTW